MKKISGIFIFFMISIFIFKRHASAAPYMQADLHLLLDGGELATTQILEFEILDVNLNKSLLAYRAIFNIYDDFDYENESQSKAEGRQAPIQCPYPGLEKYTSSSVEQWGLVDLNTFKSLETLNTLDVAANKKKCVPIKIKAERLATFKKKVTSLGLSLTRKPKLKNLEEISKELDWTILDAKGISKLKESMAPQDNKVFKENGCAQPLVATLRYKKQPVWIHPFCKSVGVMDNDHDLNLMGILKDEKSFLAVLRLSSSEGIASGPGQTEYIGLSAVLPLSLLHH